MSALFQVFYDSMTEEFLCWDAGWSNSSVGANDVAAPLSTESSRASLILTVMLYMLHTKLLHTSPIPKYVCFGPLIYYIYILLEIASRSASRCSGVLSSQVCRPAAAWLLLLERKCRIKLSVQQIFGENAISSAAGNRGWLQAGEGSPGRAYLLTFSRECVQCCSVTPPVLQLVWLPQCCLNSVS